MKPMSMKYEWISLCVCLFLLSSRVYSQGLDAEEAEIQKNQYGEMVYGNKQFPIVTFFQKDSLKYIYSLQKNRVAILGKDNRILQEVSFKNSDFSIPRFQPYADNYTILQSWGLDRDFVLVRNQTLVSKKRNIPKSKKIIGYKEVEANGGKFEVYQYIISPKNSLSKVILFRTSKKVDTLYKDYKTKENRFINVAPRAELVYFLDKTYFFNADQRLVLIFDANTGKLLQELNLKEYKDEELASFLLHFHIDITTNKMYISGVSGEKTYIWEVSNQAILGKYEIPFRIFLIHQIYGDKIYFSLQTKENDLYVYERKFR
jgi:hypothetical protein